MMSAMTEFVLEDEGEMTHDCVTLTYAATSEIAETPIENAELELFVDGSAQVIEGNRRAGYAVTSTTEVVASGRLPDHFSAQAAELVALTRACTLASGSVANIYTDSRYAFGVIHDFGVIWQTRKFLTSAGSPIKHAGLVKDLMFAMKLPKKLAVIKVKAHLTTNTTEAKGNALADVAAKQACFYATVQVCSGSTAQKIILPPESIVDLYKDVPLYEAWTWLDKGATVDSSGCWTKGGKYVAPESLLPYLAQQIHSLGHSGPATMNHRFSNQWWNPKFRNAATGTVKRCVTCQKNLRNADVHIVSDALIAYCENLTKAVQSAKERVESCWQTPPEGGHTIVPGQWVMIKAFKNKPLEPKWYGPHQVMLITAAAVLCQGRKTWTHVSHCKVVPPPAGIG